MERVLVRTLPVTESATGRRFFVRVYKLVESVRSTLGDLLPIEMTHGYELEDMSGMPVRLYAVESSELQKIVNKIHREMNPE